MLKKRFPDTNILFTMGNSGSRIVTRDEDILTGSIEEPVKDTTGAGDTYIGYFVRGLADSLSLFETVRLATAASALAVTKQGAVDSNV